MPAGGGLNCLPAASWLAGAIVVPRHLADEVARDSFEQERLEKFVAIRVSQGIPITGTYPPNDATKALYQAWIKAGEPPNG